MCTLIKIHLLCAYTLVIVITFKVLHLINICSYTVKGRVGNL